MLTTLKYIRREKPCKHGWDKLLKGLNKTKADNEPLDIKTILKINGLDDTCWVLGKVLNKDKELRLFAYWNAKISMKYVEDKKEYSKVINTVNLFAYGKADASALARAWDSAYYSAWDSARASAWARASVSASVSDSAHYSASVSDSAYYIRKAEKKLIDICNGKLPAMYKGTNYFQKDNQKG